MTRQIGATMQTWRCSIVVSVCLSGVLCGIPSFAQTADLNSIYTFVQGYGNIDGPILAKDHNLYFPYGGISRLTPDGKYTVIYGFCQLANCSDGRGPWKLIQGGDGNFYGVSSEGGPTSVCPYTGCGTVFGVSPSGKLTMHYDFCLNGTTNGGGVPICPDGYNPTAQLIQGADGDLYGLTNSTVFKITTGGVLTTIYNFSYVFTDGIQQPALLQTLDGNIIVNTHTQLVSITPTGYENGYINTNVGYTSNSPGVLVEGPDGYLYGTMEDNGTADYCNGCGTVEKVSPVTGELTTLYSFCSLPDCADGQGPSGGLVFGGDGNMYGVTAGGQGSIYQLTLDGKLTVLHTFEDETDSFELGPTDSLTPAPDGSFYGTVDHAGTNGPNLPGYFYNAVIDPAIPPVIQVTASPSVALPGTPVTFSFKVLNAFSLTMQQCYGFATTNGVTTALGKQAGTYNSTTKIYSGSFTAVPANGSYDLALTCGGIESGYATLTVGYPTTTALAASAGTVTPPGKVNLTATVARTGGGAVPTGTVTFYYQTLALGSAVLNGSGVATMQVSSQGVPAGTYPVTANYGGDGTDAASVSAATVVTVE